MLAWKQQRCYLGSVMKMAIYSPEVIIDQTAMGKEQMAKDKNRKAKTNDDTVKAKELAFVWTDDEVFLLCRLLMNTK